VALAEFIGFGIGVTASELSQWGKWKALHTDKPWLDFWKVGGPHLMANAGIDLSAYCLWAMGLMDEGLDLILHWVPFVHVQDIHLTGMLPFSPQVGVILGFGVDMVADQMAFLFKRFIVRQKETP